MHNSYIIWLLIFFVTPTTLIWTLFFEHFWKYRFVFVKIIGFSLVAGVLWDIFAINLKLWFWPSICCSLPRYKGFPMEEVLFISLATLYVSTVTILVRDLVLPPRKAKKRT